MQVGGKNVHDGMVDTVRSFADAFVSGARQLGFERHIAYFDQSYNSAEK